MRRAKHSILQISFEDQVKNLSLQHAEILGHVICSEKSLDALFREQESEAWMEAIKHSV